LRRARAYYCFCQKMTRPDTEDQPAHPDLTRDPCRLLSEAEVQARFARGSLRLAAAHPRKRQHQLCRPRLRQITIDNARWTTRYAQVGRLPDLQLANVVDDHLMEITHVIRGQEYLSSRPSTTSSTRLLAGRYPSTSTSRYPCARTAPSSASAPATLRYEDLVKLGYLPEAIVNYVALLGWTRATDREFFTMAGLDRCVRHGPHRKVQRGFFDGTISPG
jgi:glutamyl-tRNA synthetase